MKNLKSIFIAIANLAASKRAVRVPAWRIRALIVRGRLRRIELR